MIYHIVLLPAISYCASGHCIFPELHEESKPTFCTIVLLFVVSSPKCFGETYWSSSGSNMQRCFSLEMSDVVKTFVACIVIKIRL